MMTIRPLSTREVAQITRKADKLHPDGGPEWDSVVQQEAMFAGYVKTDECTCRGHEGEHGHDPLCGFASEEPLIFHIRKPLPRIGGSQFYLDKSNRFSGTWCGAEATAYDIPHRDEPIAWGDGGFAPCEKCIQAREGV